MYRYVLLCSIILLFILSSCKKNNTTTNSSQQINPTGNWSLVSIQTQQNGTTYPALQSTAYSCLTKNYLTLNDNGTANIGYSGTDTCFIVHTASQTETIGTPGDSRTGTWSQNGAAIVIKLSVANAIPNYGQILNVNGVQQLKLKDTIASINYITTAIYSK